MPLPTERTVTGKYVNPVTREPYDGTAGEHYVIFEPVPDRWTDQAGNQILLGGGRVDLAADGTFSEDVVCTDSADVLPADGRLWRLRQYVGGSWATQHLMVPAGDGPLDITDALSVDLSGVEYVPVPGPKGDTGAQGVTGPQGEPGLDGGLDTGITLGGHLSPNAANPLAIDISPLTGRIVDYSTNPPTVTEVATTSTVTVELDSVAQSRAVTWLLMGPGQLVFQQGMRPSPEERRNFLVLGFVVQEGGQIVLAQSIPTIIGQPINQFYDFLDAFGAFPISGNTISPNGANLTLNHAPGEVFSRGWNHFDGTTRTNNPHVVATVGASPAPWVHVLRNSDIRPSTATTAVDVARYDSNGVLTPVTGSADNAVVHQLWILPTFDGQEIHVLQYGQEIFASLAEAVQHSTSASVSVNPALPGNAVLLAYLAVKHTATNLSDPTQAQIIPVSRFGGGGSGVLDDGGAKTLTQLFVDRFGAPAGHPLGRPGSAESVSILSSFAGGEDDGTGTDSTGRLNLYSYQRAQNASFGETVRKFLMRKDAKAMIAWYGPEQPSTQTAGYGADRNAATGVTWTPWAWIGAHYEANDHNSIHGHWSIEVPDTTGALQTRLEVPFVDQEGDTTQIGVNTTNIRTHQADLTVSADSGVLRVGGGNDYNKDILLSGSSFRATSARRWIIRADSTTESGNAAGTDFRIIRHNDAGAAQDAPLFIKRSTGRVGIGGTAGSLAPSAPLHVESQASTVPVVLVKQPTAGNDSVATLQVESPSATKRLMALLRTGDTVPRIHALPSGSGTGGELVFGDGTTADTNLYRAAANTLKTDDLFSAVGVTSTTAGTTSAGTFATSADGTASLGVLVVNPSTIAKRAVDIRLAADTVSRIRMDFSAPSGNGMLSFGDGTAVDVNLYRSAANVLATDDKLLVTRASSGNTAFGAQVTGDSFDRVQVLVDGTLEWGAGSAARDTNLYRSAANVLKTDDKFIATAGLGVGNSAAATTPGTLTRKIEVFDATGASLGFIPVYSTIT